MKLEKTNISSTQLTFLMLSFILVGVLPLSFSMGITGRDTWIAIIIALCISFLLVLIYVSLAQKFPDKNLVQINDIIYGPYLGKLISVLYIIFFLSVISANFSFIADFWRTYLMPETPKMAFLVMFGFVCIWAVRSGIEVITRCSFYAAIIITFIILFTTVLLLKDMKITNFLPIFQTPIKKFILSVHILISIPFCEVVVFLMIFPHTNKTEQIKRSALIAVTLGGIFLLITTFRDTAVLGVLATISNAPNFVAIRQINIGDILTRLDILVAAGLMISVFIKITVFLYSAVFGITNLLHLRSYLPLAIPIGIITIIYGNIMFRSSMEQVYDVTSFWPFFATLFEFLIPIISLFIAQIRGFTKEQGGKCK